jgi:tRNA(fMet)-specific endonuclease VapC
LLVLDTDHFSELERNIAPGQRLALRLKASRMEKALTVVTVEEEVRGWLAQIGRQRDVHCQVAPYAKLQRQVEAFADWLILPWDGDAAELFVNFRRQGLRLGSLDLKIACIVLAHDAILLTRNVTDFAQVPDLRFENWLE